MPRVHEGGPSAAGKRVAIVASRFNEFISARLVSSAIDCLVRHGGDDDMIDVYWVPGAFEVPQIAMRLARGGKCDGIVCVGAIVRGETNHYDNLCGSVIRALADVAAQCSVPVAYGIVTADTMEQAMNRAGGKNGDKGRDSALALIEMMSLWES